METLWLLTSDHAGSTDAATEQCVKSAFDYALIPSLSSLRVHLVWIFLRLTFREYSLLVAKIPSKLVVGARRSSLFVSPSSCPSVRTSW